jgi:acetyl-CoA C-acetyltransferase
LGRYALGSHQLALQAQTDGWFEPELVALGNERFELAGYQSRSIQLPRGVDLVTRDV